MGSILLLFCGERAYDLRMINSHCSLVDATGILLRLHFATPANAPRLVVIFSDLIHLQVLLFGSNRRYDPYDLP